MPVLPTTRVRGHISLPDGTAQRTGRIEFMLDTHDIDDDAGMVVLPELRVVDLQGDGEVDVELWSNRRGTYGSVYDVTAVMPIGLSERRLPLGQIEVPLNGPADLEDLLAFGPDRPIDDGFGSSARVALSYPDRAAAVEDLSHGKYAPEGFVFTAGDESYRRVDGARVLPDLPGWVPSGSVVSLRHWPVAADGVTDDAPHIESWIAYLDRARLEGYAPAGDYAVGYASDRDLANDIIVRCHPKARFIGLPTKFDVEGDGALTQATVTSFTPGPNGYVVIYIANGNETVWTEGEQYTVSGATIRLDSGTTPHGPLAVGHRLRVVAANPMILLDSRTVSTSRFEWHGGEIDNSQRGFAPAQASGSGLTIQEFKSYAVRGTRFIAGTDHESSAANGTSDSGFTTLTCSGGVIEGCYFVGHADLGIYITGGVSPEEFDNGQQHLVTGNHFYRCNNGVSAKREARGIAIIGNVFEQCDVGATLYVTRHGVGGGRGVIANNTFVKCGKRAIDVRASRGVIIHDNVIRDLGYRLDETTEVGNSTALQVHGCTHVKAHSNVFFYEELPAPANVRAIRINDHEQDGVTQSDCCTVHDNLIDGFATGLQESDAGTGNQFHANQILNTGTPIQVPAGRRWHYRANNVEVEGIGDIPFEGAWTPTVMLVGATPDISYNTQSGRYVRRGNIVTAFCEINARVTHALIANQLRIEGLPFSSRDDVDQKGSGNSTFMQNLNFPAGTVLIAPEVAPDNTYVRFRALMSGSAGEYLSASAVSSGISFRMDFMVVYEVQPEPLT